jgi:hypothetical protein
MLSFLSESAALVDQLIVNLIASGAASRCVLQYQARHVSFSRMCSKHCQDAYRSFGHGDWRANAASGWGCK